MGTQSTAKTIFLLTSMVGWLIFGASLMYLFPAIADRLINNDLIHTWMATLSRGSYQPMLGVTVGGVACAFSALLTVVWYQQFEERI